MLPARLLEQVCQNHLYSLTTALGETREYQDSGLPLMTRD